MLLQVNKSWMSCTDLGKILKFERTIGEVGVVCYYKLLNISRALWHYRMVWKSYEIFGTSDLSQHNSSENENITCFRMLTWLHQSSECKVSQFRDTVALYGQHSGPFCFQGLLLYPAIKLACAPECTLRPQSSSPGSPVQCFISTRSTTIFAQSLRVLLWP